MKESRRRQGPTAPADTTSSPLPLGTWLSARQVLASLGISRRSLDRLLSSGQFPQPIRLGRSMRWREDVIRTYLQKLKAQATDGRAC